MRLTTLLVAVPMSAVLLLTACDTAVVPSAPLQVGVAKVQHTVITTITKEEIPSLDGETVAATAMNGSGQIVGHTGEIRSHLHLPGRPVFWDGTTLRDLGTFGGAKGTALGINNLGHVVGVAENAAGRTRAFFWDGVLHELEGFESSPAFATDAQAINDADEIVGTIVSETFVGHAVVWRGGAPIDLGALGSSPSGWFINSVGQAVGNGVLSPQSVDYHDFLWDNGTIVDLGIIEVVAMNDAGQVAGSFVTDVSRHAAIWSNGVMRDLHALLPEQFTQPYSVAVDINNAGQVVGYSFDNDAPGSDRAFLWDGITMHDLGTLGGQHSFAYGINDAGQVAGASTTASGIMHAFLWEDGAMLDLGAIDGRVDDMFVDDAGHVAATGETSSGHNYTIRWTVSQRAATPTEEIQITQTTLDNVASRGGISNGHATALRAKLDAAARQVERGNANAAKNILQAFINQVQNLVSRGSLSAADGQALIATAQAAIDKL